jgi:hypothetical protein
MKTRRLLLLAALTTIFILIAALPMGVAFGQLDVTCPNGQRITNGVEFNTNVRPGNTYRVTVLGVDGFDPVVAVIPDVGSIECNDDSEEASEFSGFLPTTGEIVPSSLNSSVTFSNRTSDFMDVQIVVGGFGGSAGEFVLLFEGLAYTSADGDGDPFNVNVSANVISAGVPLSAYVIGLSNSLDPKITIVDADNDPIFQDGEEVYCDDANSTLCYGDGADTELSGSFILTPDEMIIADSLDPVLIIPTAGLDPTIDYEFSYINYLISSFAGSSTGDYLVAFHLGEDDPSLVLGNGNNTVDCDPKSGNCGDSSGNDIGEILTIEYDDTLTGTLISGELASYSFEADRNDFVSVVLTPIGFDAGIVLMDEDTNVLASDTVDDGETGTPILAFQIPSSGTYFLVIGDPNDTNASGTFLISLIGT